MVFINTLPVINNHDTIGERQPHFSFKIINNSHSPFRLVQGGLSITSQIEALWSQLTALFK